MRSSSLDAHDRCRVRIAGFNYSLATRSRLNPTSLLCLLNEKPSEKKWTSFWKCTRNQMIIASHTHHVISGSVAALFKNICLSFKVLVAIFELLRWVSGRWWSLARCSITLMEHDGHYGRKNYWITWNERLYTLNALYVAVIIIIVHYNLLYFIYKLV